MNILLIIQILILIYFALGSRRVDENLVRIYKQTFQLAFLAPLSIHITDKLKIMDRLSSYLIPIHHRIMSLYSFKEGKVYTLLFVAQLVGAICLCSILSTLFAVLADDPTLLGFGVFLTIIVPFFLIRGLQQQLEKKKQQILMELPEVLNKIVLLVNAGETVQRAIVKIQKSKVQQHSILYVELQQVATALKNNTSFRQALEDMSRRCGVQEVSVFTTTILLNYRRGGNDLVVALRMLSKELWQKRKTLTKTLGEQASSKLVFPMVLIFIIVLVVIATPAILLI